MLLTNTRRHQSIDIYTKDVQVCKWKIYIVYINKDCWPLHAFPIDWHTTLQTNKANKSNKGRHHTAPSQSEELVWITIYYITLIHIPTHNMCSLCMTSAEGGKQLFSSQHIPTSAPGWTWYETQNSAGRFALPSSRCWACLDDFRVQ